MLLVPLSWHLRLFMVSNMLHKLRPIYLNHKRRHRRDSTASQRIRLESFGSTKIHSSLFFPRLKYKGQDERLLDPSNTLRSQREIKKVRVTIWTSLKTKDQFARQLFANGKRTTRSRIVDTFPKTSGDYIRPPIRHSLIYHPITMAYVTTVHRVIHRRDVLDHPRSIVSYSASSAP